MLKKVGILTEEQTTYSATNQLSEVETAIIKYKNHPSITAITDRMEKLGKPTFNFKLTSHEGTEKEVNNLKIKKKIRYSSKNYQGKCRYYFIFPIS